MACCIDYAADISSNTSVLLSPRDILMVLTGWTGWGCDFIGLIAMSEYDVAKYLIKVEVLFKYCVLQYICPQMNED